MYAVVCRYVCSLFSLHVCTCIHHWRVFQTKLSTSLLVCAAANQLISSYV